MVSNAKYIMGVLTASAIGAVVGYIWAQEEHTPLGQQIKRRVGDLADKAVDSIQHSLAGTEEPLQQVENKAYEMKGRVEQATSDFQSRLEGGFGGGTATL
jgi:hypothetical protein